MNKRKKYVYVNEVTCDSDIKIEDIYIKNNDLNRIIASLIHGTDIEINSAELSAYSSNITKKKNEFFANINLKPNTYKIGARYCYPLEIAAMIIAYFVYPVRTKDSFTDKIIHNNFSEITGNQLLGFLDLTSLISSILISSRYETNQKLDEIEYLKRIIPKLKKETDNYINNDYLDYNSYSFTNQPYMENSDKFNELVMYANIKAQEEELVESMADEIDNFLHALFVSISEMRNTKTNEYSDIYEALKPIGIPYDVDELDTHTTICMYQKYIERCSEKFINAIKVMHLVNDRGDLYDILGLSTSTDVLRIVLGFFDSYEDSNHTVYENAQKIYRGNELISFLAEKIIEDNTPIYPDYFE